MNLRATAARVLVDVIQNGLSLSDCLKQKISLIKDPRDKGFLQALCFGVCRFYFRLDQLAQLLLEKPLKEKDADIYCLILLGLYQLIEMRLPEYAAVAETVSAAKALKKIWAKNLVNAILRNYL